MSTWLESKCGTTQDCDPRNKLTSGVYYNFTLEFDKVSEELLEYMMISYSSRVNVRSLSSFHLFINEELFKNNKSEIIEILIAKMLKGDVVANAMYEEIYFMDENYDMLLSYTQISQDSVLEGIYDSVMGENPFPITQAIHWLNNTNSSQLQGWYDTCCSLE